MVSPRGRGCSARGMGGRCSRGGTHNSTAMSGSRGSHGGGGSHSYWRGLEPLAKEGEERRTRGQKARPPRVFTMLELEEEKKWRGGLQILETGCEMKRKEKKKGLYKGRGANERSWPINGLKCLLNGWFKEKGKLMAGVGNEGFAVDER